MTETLPGGSSLTWEDALYVPGEDPIQQGVEKHHDDGQQQGVATPLFRTLAQVMPLDSDTLLLVLGEVFAAVAKGHARQEALDKRGDRNSSSSESYRFPVQLIQLQTGHKSEIDPHHTPDRQQSICWCCLKARIRRSF